MQSLPDAIIALIWDPVAGTARVLKVLEERLEKIIISSNTKQIGYPIPPNPSTFTMKSFAAAAFLLATLAEVAHGHCNDLLARLDALWLTVP